MASSWSDVGASVNTAGTRGYGTPAVALPVLAGNIISLALGLIGLIVFGYGIYAGFLWLTARGDAKQVTQAKETLQNVIIGLVIVGAAYAISTFILTAIMGATNPQP